MPSPTPSAPSSRAFARKLPTTDSTRHPRSRLSQPPRRRRAPASPVAELLAAAVINATGVILHTNLGRAPLAAAAFDHIRETALAYSNLEFDLETGERGQRDIHVDRLFQKLFEESPE